MLDIANMGERCIVAECSNENKDGVSLFKFPKRKEIREQWIKRVKTTRAGFTSPSDYLVTCSCHYSEDCFKTFWDSTTQLRFIINFINIFVTLLLGLQ